VPQDECQSFLSKCYSESQYKYQFKTWGWKKNVPATKKAQMCEIERTRASLGKSTVMKYKGQDLDPNKLRRYAKMASRKDVVLPASRSQGLSDGGFFNSQHPLGNTMYS
jgi:CTP-dependent riboflavin kinase